MVGILTPREFPVQFRVDGLACLGSTDALGVWRGAPAFAGNPGPASGVGRAVNPRFRNGRDGKSLMPWTAYWFLWIVERHFFERGLADVRPRLRIEGEFGDSARRHVGDLA